MAVATQTPLTSTQLRRLAPSLRPATAKGFVSGAINPDDYQNVPKCDRISQLRLSTKVNHVNRQRKATKTARAWVLDSEDSVELARSCCPMPSDGCRNKPRLKCEEALLAPERTRNYRLTLHADDAYLYWMGLLYDDEYEVRGPGFCLNAIDRPEPAFTVRPPKLVRKGRVCSRYEESGSDLPLGLTFSALGSDSDITHSLVAPEVDEFPVSEHEIFCRERHVNDEIMRESMVTLPSTPLHIIYEVLEDSTPSLPDLVSESEGAEDGNDWAVVPRRLRSNRSLASHDADADADDVTAPTAETWVVLSDSVG